MSSGGSKNQTVKNEQKMNPQLEAMLFGSPDSKEWISTGGNSSGGHWVSNGRSGNQWIPDRNSGDGYWKAVSGTPGLLDNAMTDFGAGKFSAQNPYANSVSGNINAAVLGNDFNNSLTSPSLGVAAQYLSPEMWDAERSRQMGLLGNFDTGPNPYADAQYDSMIGRAFDDIQNRVGGSTNMAGQAGSPQAQRIASQQFSQAATDTANQFKMQQYDKDQALRLGLLDRQLGVNNDILGRQMAGQMGVLGMAPQLGNQEFNDFLMRQQSRLDAGDASRNNAMEKYNAYQRMVGLLGIGSGGGTSTQNSPIYRNQAAGALGGAASGAMMGSYFGPVGMGVGAGVGGLLGYMG